MHLRLPALLAALVLASLAAASPFLPPRPPVSDEVRSLAHLKQVQLHIGQLPEAIATDEFTRQTIDAHWRKRLARAAIKVQKIGQAPRLMLNVQVRTDTKMPERLVVIGLLTLEQGVNVIRLDRPLHLPTYINFSIWTKSRQHVKDVIQPEILGIIDSFLAKVDQANEE